MELSFPAGWAYRTKLSLKRTVCGTTMLTNFAVPLVWTGSQSTSNIPEALVSGLMSAKADGSDIRFSTDKLGTLPIPFEIVSFSINSDSSLAHAEIWVCLTKVYSHTDTNFYIWWGESTASSLLVADTCGKYSVWDTNYSAVYHLNETSGSILDSTTNQISGTSGANFPNDSTLYGKIGNGQHFISTNANYIDFGSSTKFDYTTAFTIECWINIQSYVGTWMTVISKGDTAWRLHRSDGANSIRMTISTSGGVSNADTGILNIATWYHIVGRYDGTNLQIFVNGVSISSVSSSSCQTNTATLRLSDNSQQTGRYFNGYIDEVHLSNIARSNDWILTSYNTQFNPAASFIIGSVENVSGVLVGWNRVCALTIDRTKVTQVESALPIPLIWTGSQSTSNIPQEMMITDGLYTAKSDGSDIRVTFDPNGAELQSIEIVTFSQNYDPSQARAEIWVRVKNIAVSQNTVIYLWYNNPFATAVDYLSSDGPQTVWRDTITSYRLWSTVCHMNGSSDGFDSTYNNLTFTNYGSTEFDGGLSKCRYFNGSSYMTRTNLSYDDFSICFWIKPNGNSPTGSAWYNGYPIFSADSYYTSTNGWSITYLNNSISFGIGNPDTTITSTTTINDGNWHYVVCTRIRTTGVFKIYIDGVLTNTGTGNTNRLNVSSQLTIGCYSYSSSLYFNGYLDEVWIMPLAQTAAQVTAMYNSQNSPQSFISISTPTNNIFPYAWKWKTVLTQDYTKNSNDITGFVTLLAWTGSQSTSNLPENMMILGDSKAAKSDGSDIRVTTDALGQNQLPLEIVSFSLAANSANSIAEIYVRIPTVSASTNVQIYVWWGNSSATAYSYYHSKGRNNVWIDYWMVFHFQNNFIDSTGNGFDATGVNSPTNVAGPVAGRAANFIGSNSQYAYLPSIPASLNLLYNNGYYITSWVQYNSFSESYSRIFDFGSGADQDNIFFSHKGTTADSRYGVDNNTTEAILDFTNTFSLNTWQFFGLSLLNNSTIYMNVNGVAVANMAASIRQAVRNNNYFGRSNWSADGYLTGKIDEFRFKKFYSTGENLADYNSNSSPSTYWIYGPITVTSNWFLLQMKNTVYNTMNTQLR